MTRFSTTKDGRVQTPLRVLVIDESSDTETVLRAVLEPRGTAVERSRRHTAATRSEVDSVFQDVIVIDLDADPQSLQSVSAQAGSHSRRVVLGSQHPPRDVPCDRFLSKPFQYPELIRVVEELLEDRKAA